MNPSLLGPSLYAVVVVSQLVAVDLLERNCIPSSIECKSRSDYVDHLAPPGIVSCVVYNGLIEQLALS